MTDVPRRLPQQRPAVRDERRALEFGLAHHSADPQHAVGPAEHGELLYAVDVDEKLRASEPEVHQRHQALAPR